MYFKRGVVLLTLVFLQVVLSYGIGGVINTDSNYQLPSSANRFGATYPIAKYRLVKRFIPDFIKRTPHDDIHELVRNSLKYG